MAATPLKLGLFAGCAALALSACDTLPDLDLRDLGDGFDTSEAVENLPDRPAADARGVISYPTYQVAVAQRGDSVASVALRVGTDAAALARFNGLTPETELRAGEVVALPTRVSEPVPVAGGLRDVAAIATTALDRAGPQTPVATTALPAASVPAPTPDTPEPIRHQVRRGETVFSIARLYGVPVSSIAEWNGLAADLAIREGQFLLIPQGAGGGRAPLTALAPEPVTPAPGTGSATPVPPSAATPLPASTPAPAAAPTPPADTPEPPDLGNDDDDAEPVAAPPATASNARLQFPVRGTIIRDYAPGRNEGIDIGVAAGTPVQAADGGTVAAVTTDTNGVAIVVIKHPDNLLTVYTNLEDLSIAKGASVSRGQTIGKVRAGSPSFLHFETRRGLQSVDPNTLLPG